MEDKLQTLHANLIKEGYDLPDYNTFKLDMADPIKSKKLHDNLTTEGYDLPDYGTFLKDMSVKKKVSSQDAFTSASGKEEIPFLGQSGKNLVNPQSSSTQPLQSTSVENKPIEQPKPKDRETTAIGDVLRSLKSGSLRALGGITGTPNFISRTITGLALRPFVKAQGGTDEQANAVIDNLMLAQPQGQVMLGGAKAQESLNKIAKKTEAKMFPIEGSIFQNLKEGKDGHAGELLMRGIFQSAPYLAMTAATAGGGTAAILGTIGATSAAQQYAELEGQPESKRVLNAWMYGGFEAAGELVTAGIVNSVGRAFKQGVITEVKQEFIKGAVKQISIDFGLEASSEMATQLGQNLTDIITGTDPNRNIFDGVIDAGLIGGVSGGGLGVAHIPAAIIGRSLASDKQVTQVQDNVKQQEVLIDQIESTDSDPVKTALESRLKTLKFEANQVMDANYHLAEQMSPEQKSKAAELYSTWNELQAKLDNKDVYTEIAVKAVENTIEGIKEQIQTLKQEVASDVAKKEAKNAVEDKVKEGDAKPKIAKPEEIAKSNDITFLGKQEGFDGGEGLDLYNVEVNGQTATFAVPSGSNELTVKAKKEDTVSKFKPKSSEVVTEKEAQETPYTEINSENIDEVKNNYISSLPKEEQTPEKVADIEENVDLIKDYLNERLDRGKGTGSEGLLQGERPEDIGSITEGETGGDVSAYPKILADRRGINRESKLTPEEQVSQSVAPNGNKSNLSPENFARVRTPEFKARFGDWQKGEGSFVLDRNGEPMVVYHGAPELYVNGVDPTMTNSKESYFTGNKEAARVYARFGAKQPVIYEGFLSMNEGNKNIDKLPGFESTHQEYKTTSKDQFIPTKITHVEGKIKVTGKKVKTEQSKKSIPLGEEKPLDSTGDKVTKISDSVTKTVTKSEDTSLPKDQKKEEVNKEVYRGEKHWIVGEDNKTLSKGDKGDASLLSSNTSVNWEVDKPSVIIHTHPDQSMFSGEDLTMLWKGATKEIRIISPDGTVISAKRVIPEGETYSDRVKKGNSSPKDVKDRWNEAENEIFDSGESKELSADDIIEKINEKLKATLGLEITKSKVDDYKGQEWADEFIADNTPAKDQSTLSGKPLVTDNKVEEVPNTEQKPSESAPISSSDSNTPPKPPESKIQGETTGETGKEQYTLGVRALSSGKIDQDIKDAISKEGIDYIPRGRKVRAEEAQEIVNLFSKETNGLDKISEMIHNSGNGIENDTRTYLNVYLASEYNRLKNEATDAPTREKYRQKTSEAYLYGFDQGRKAGVWVEAQKEWGKVFGSSPEMVQAITRLHIERKNKGFFSSHQEEIEAGKKLFEDVFNSEEGRAKIEAEVSAEIAKIGTSKFGAEGKKKVDDFFSSLLIDPKRQQFYDALLGIPVAAWNGSVLAVKNAILVGMDVASAVQKGVEHLDKWYKENYDKGAVNSPDWNKKEYEAHMAEKLGGLKKEVPVADKTKKPTTQKTKIPPTQEEMVNKLLEKMAGFATKKQLQNFVKDYFQEHVEKGYVSDQRYKDLLSKALGMDYMSPKIEADLTASAQALGNAQKKMQELQDAFDKILQIDPTSPEFKELRKGLDNLKKEVDKANFGAQKANQHIKTMLTEEQGLTDKIGTLIQGNLLVPASILRNIYGNVFFMPARGARYLVMNTMDSILSGFGKQFEKHLKIDPVAHPDLYRWSQKLPSSTRTVKMGASLRGGAEGFMSGLKEGLRQVKTGQLEDDYQKKEIQRGLEPVKAAVRIWDNLTGAERRNWSKTVGDVLEALPAGYMGEGMFRLLNLGDKPFRRKAEQGRLSEIASIKGYKGLRREQFMSNPDNASLKDAQNEGDIAVYTNDNIVSKLIQHANTVISKGEQSNKDAIKNTSAIAKVLFKLGKATTLPYVRTPVNLMAESFEYAIPAYSFARAMEATYKGNRREALDYFGKAVVGTVISSVALTLIKNGVMTPGSSDDDKVKQAEFSAKEGYRLNLDAFHRMISGENTDWQDGDNTVTLKGYGTLSMIMMAYADAFKDKTPEEMANQSPTDVWATVFPSVITSGLEQSIMTGVNTALQAALKGEKERDRWLINTAGALSATVYPNTVTNISKTFADENYIRETRDMSKEEGQFKAQMVNTFKDRMFMGKDLPTKVSIWGDKVNLIPEGNTWTWNLLGVSKNKKYQKYSFGTKMFELYEDYKTKDPEEAKNIFPSLPNAKTKVGWKDALMTPMELQDYQIRVGQIRAEYAENYVNSEEFKDAALEDKVSTLTTMYGKARKIAEKEMFDWTAYKERASDKWQYMYDNDVLPLPSMVRTVGQHKLTKEDKEMLNDMAIGFYGDMVQGIVEQINKLPIEAKVNMLNGRWNSAIGMAKAKMNVILSSESKK